MKKHLYIATITAIILASVGMVTAYPTPNQDALPSFVLKTKIIFDFPESVEDFYFHLFLFPNL